MFGRFRSLVVIAAVGALALAAPGTARAAGQVTDLLWTATEDGGQLQVVAAGDVVFTTASLPAPDRLVIDCLGGAPRGVQAPDLPAGGPVDGISVASRELGGIVHISDEEISDINAAFRLE